jgi:hypothetical protein
VGQGQLPELPPGALFAVREAVDDVHHGLAERKAIAHSDALKHVLDCAEAAGVPTEERERMAREGFQRIFEGLAPPKRRWRKSLFRRSSTPDAQPVLPRGDQVRQLPSGDRLTPE